VKAGLKQKAFGNSLWAGFPNAPPERKNICKTLTGIGIGSAVQVGLEPHSYGANAALVSSNANCFLFQICIIQMKIR
jgi:hypothetical protein